MFETLYFQKIEELLKRVHDTQTPVLVQAAQRIAESLARGGVLHIFGSGHSAIIGKEITQRAGGLVPVNLIPDPSEGIAERIEGYGKVLLDVYERKYGLKTGEVIIVISTSGRNPAPIDVALEAKARGLYTIGITSVEYSRQLPSRHSSGKRLFELVDLIIDNCVPPGDAILEVEGLEQRVGASSTLAGVLLINMLMLRVIEELLKQGEVPPILKSQNLDGADEFNKKLLERYKGRLTF